ncbi:MAG: phosphonopyruvate decarboxylase [Gammaproteobacteria bacterium GWF2_41_13]|nr:MAG: phosphonopyruvate decarboxylase [Gammaproteobacteria bacterium GWF2_41_13]
MKKINCALLFDCLRSNGINFFAGVPDSLLKDFCAYVTDNASNKEHIIAANEGAAVALATGHYLATGKVPLVYFQNSGLGHATNPLLSLADKEVYSIPMIMMIGWRGEPGVKDEPQHVKQGRVQNNLLDAMEIPYKILDEKVSDVAVFVNEMVRMAANQSSPVAIVVRGDTFEPYKATKKEISPYVVEREAAIQEVLRNLSGQEVVVSTTGKISRELFECRVANHEGHQNDFLTVGSMGHASQIALGIALSSDKKVICLDGDGAVIMHMGSLAISGLSKVENFVHIVLNNGAHDSVGGQPTVGFKIDLVSIAKACGYQEAISVSLKDEIVPALKKLMSVSGPVFLEIRVKKGSRTNLGRPTKSPLENKKLLMHTLGT